MKNFCFWVILITLLSPFNIYSDGVGYAHLDCAKAHELAAFSNDDPSIDLSIKDSLELISVPEDILRIVEPYLLPNDHPTKGALDQIFSASRATFSEAAMKKAGFFDPYIRSKGMIVTGHPRLKGYLIKVFLDDYDVPEWAYWVKRIEGAKTVQAVLDKYGYNKIMKVPKKWIYHLPNSPAPKEGSPFPKSFVLVVQDMGIVGDEANTSKYRYGITKVHLEALYKVITECKLVDSVYLDNIPFCFDNKIAFLDTEWVNVTDRKLKLNYLTKYFSPDLQKYWLSLIIPK